MERARCAWVGEDPLSVAYHDREWGTPQHDDRVLFEFVLLEGAQAGLSWMTILRKRENYRRAFDGFDPTKIARYRAPRIAKLLADEGIVRNRLKIEAAVANARAFLAVQKQEGSFESDAMSEALRARGFRFVGSTICYAFMQACGLVDDHTRACFRAVRR